MDNLLSDEMKKEQVAGIIYCASRREVRDVSAHLTKCKIPNVQYHSGMSSREKKIEAEKWYSDKISVVVGTNAFAMGIDKQNVGWIIHNTMPMSLTDLYQKSGRAGRDPNLKANIYVCFKFSDRLRLQMILRGLKDFKNPPGNIYDAQVMKKLREMWQVIEWGLNEHICRKTMLYSFFDQAFAYEECKHPESGIYTCDIKQKFHCGNTIELMNVQKIVYGLMTLFEDWDHKKRQYNRMFKSVVDILCGSKNEKIMRYHDNQCKLYGICASWKRPWVESLICYLLVEEYIAEEYEESPYSRAWVGYLKKGRKAWKLGLKASDIYFRVPKKVIKKSEKAKKQKAKKQEAGRPKRKYKKRNKKKVAFSRKAKQK